MNKLAIVFLITSEDVIGTIVDETDTHITIDGALSIFVSPDEEGTPVFYFKKYCMHTTDFLVTFKKEHVLSVFTNPIKPICKHYSLSMKQFKIAQEKLVDMTIEEFQSSINDEVSSEEVEETTYETITVH